MVISEIVGYIVKVQKYKDSDAIITIFTKEGLFSIYGRGYKNVKSKYHILNNLFLKIKILGTQGKFLKIKDFEILEYNQLEYDNFNVIQTAVKVNKYIINILNSSKVPNSKNLEQLYNAYDFMIKNINDNNNVFMEYYIKLLLIKVSGIEFNYSQCTFCTSKKIVTFSLSDGGLVCQQCYNNQRIMSLREIKKIKILWEQDIYLINKEYLKYMTNQYNEKYYYEIDNVIENTIGIY